MDDLNAEGGGELTGYWGGFNGEVDGVALGFLSPLSNGDGFHGKAIQVGLHTLEHASYQSEAVAWAAGLPLIF